jgi:hypothetical protein
VNFSLEPMRSEQPFTAQVTVVCLNERRAPNPQRIGANMWGSVRTRVRNFIQASRLVSCKTNDDSAKPPQRKPRDRTTSP